MLSSFSLNSSEQIVMYLTEVSQELTDYTLLFHTHTQKIMFVTKHKQ